MIKNYKNLNNVFGWLTFVLATVIYFLTMEPTVSFWDCGEFISAAFKLEVGHQPGAPLFAMIGRMFSLLAGHDVKMVAFWVNTCSVLASAGTIMLLFWTITALALKLIKKEQEELSTIQKLSIIGAGLVGAFAYAFSDTFWFSAVEGEVYAMSSLCTALVFWAMLKWEARAAQPDADKWLVFIAFILGLSIGIHILNLLVIPAMVFVYYFKKTHHISKKGILITLFAACALVGLVQYGIIQYLVLFMSRFDLFFVNTLKMGFGVGALTFILLLAAVIAAGIVYSIKKGKRQLNLALVCFTFILFGYSSYVMTLVRAQAKTNINLSNPDSPMGLFGYLGRDNYGDRPLLYGQYFDSEYTGTEQGASYYRKEKNSYELAGTKFKYTYDRNTLFPRMYSADKPEHIAAYKAWTNLGEGQHPTFADNLKFFSAYQVGFMYFRYFMWNFAGRQNDVQGQGDKIHGNWITGIKPIDAIRLGNQDKLPASITENEGYNRFFALPLILGLLGFVFHIKKQKKDALIIGLLFFFTGLAIILYLNQAPMQVRERDYAFAGSFYAFAIWIGLGVLALREYLSKVSGAKLGAYMAVCIGLLAAPAIMGYEGWDDHTRANKYTARDMAANYLNSCAPNAILFTNADNDTYPLWYAQEVEGIRRDVRVVSLQLLQDASFVDQLKKQAYSSEPLPISMARDKYKEGIRDVLPFANYGLTDSVELKELVGVMLSDDDGDKIDMQSGKKENFLPTKKFKLTVDAQQLVSTGTIKPEEQDRVAPVMEWNYNKNYVSRSDLAALDIISNNNWKRPIYFTVQLSEDSYLGMDKYLHTEGYAYRLLPFKRDAADKRDKSEVTHSDVMYDNMMNKYELSSFKKASYLDPETKRVAYTTTRQFNTLASNLYSEGKVEKAKKVMDRCLAVMPMRNYSIMDTVNKLFMAGTLYQLQEQHKATAMVTNSVDYIKGELAYYASLTPGEQYAASDEIRTGLSLLNSFGKLAEDNKQPALAKRIMATLNSYGNQFMGAEGS